MLNLLAAAYGSRRTTRRYGDRKDMALEAATCLRTKQPNSAITVRDIESGQTTTIKHSLESL